MVLLLVSSCGTSVNFSVSRLVPAADISASVKKDNNNNYDIKVTTKYLANPNISSAQKLLCSMDCYRKQWDKERRTVDSKGF